jgi:hypothetical protein
MSHFRPLVLGFLLALTASGRCVSASEPAVPAVPPTSTMEVASEVDRVVLYRGGADIRRSVELTLEPGIHEIVFTGIPDPNAQGLQGLRASTGGGWTVVGVETFSGLSDAARREFELEARKWDEERRLEQARRTMTEAGLVADLE